MNKTKATGNKAMKNNQEGKVAIMLTAILAICSTFFIAQFSVADYEYHWCLHRFFYQNNQHEQLFYLSSLDYELKFILEFVFVAMSLAYF